MTGKITKEEIMKSIISKDQISDMINYSNGDKAIRDFISTYLHIGIDIYTIVILYENIVDVAKEMKLREDDIIGVFMALRAMAEKRKLKTK